MKLTKLWMILALVGILFSCSEEDTIIDNPDTGEALDLVADLSSYQNSPLGMYKGVFTTTDSEQRGVVEIKVINEEVARATIKYVDGNIEGFRGKIVQQDLSMKISFVSRTSSFDFEVGQDGSAPTVSNANSNAKASLITVIKENTRGAVTPLTGTFESSIGEIGTWNIVFNTGSDEGDNTDITTQSIFNAIDYGSATGNEQSGCNSVDSVTTCTIGGSYTSQGVAITWTGSHTFLDLSDCSSAVGTWTAGISSGTWTTDNVCTTPGDYLQTAIPIVPTAEGTADTCETPNFVVDFTGFTNSGLNDDTTCFLSTGADIFYSWTSTTEALVYRAEQISQNASEDIIIRDTTGAFITCVQGSLFGGTTLSGWVVGDPLIIQITNITSETTGFCLAEASIPTVPGNDLCMDAFPIACGETDSGSTLLATDSTGASGNDVFYSFTPTVEGQFVTVSLCGSGYDTRLRVLDSCGGTEIIGNDDNFIACGPGGNSQLTFTASLGVEYIIVVEAFSTQSGSYSIAVTCVDPAPVCGGTTTDFVGATGTVAGCPTGTDFVATSTATGTIGTDADIDNVSVAYINSAFSTPIVNITLTSPAGTSLDLASSVNANDDISAIYRDGGNPANVATGEIQPSGGTFATAFDGESVTGDWTLTVCDETDLGNDVTSWSISFCDGDIPDPSFAPENNSTATRSSNDAMLQAARERERLYAERKRQWIEENNK